MKKTNLTGWRDVYTFTLLQTLKSKAFIVSFVILMVLAIVSMPVIRLITGGSDENAPNPVTKVYVNNQSSLPEMDFSGLLKEDAFCKIDFTPMKEDYDTVSQRIEEEEHTSAILTIAEEEGSYILNFAKATKGPVKDSDLQRLGTAVEKQFDAFKINALGITGEQSNLLHAPIETEVIRLDENGDEIIKEDTSISNTEYWFVYGILFVVMMVNTMAGSRVATSIVTEKSTRVVEYLLISIKPLALMVGKILSMLTSVLLQFVSMIILLFLSNAVSASLSPSGTQSVMAQYLPDNILGNISIVNILLCLITVALGLIFYATLAALAGATVSKLEQISEGLTLFTLSNVIGAYIGIAAAGTLMGAGENGFVIFALLFPLSSPFLLPGALLIGKASPLLAAAAILLLVIFVALLFKFVAKIYEFLILHNGSRIKITELIKLSKAV